MPSCFLTKCVLRVLSVCLAGADFCRGQQRCGTELFVEPAVFRVSGGDDQHGRLQESRRVSEIGFIKSQETSFWHEIPRPTTNGPAHFRKYRELLTPTPFAHR